MDAMLNPPGGARRDSLSRAASVPETGTRSSLSDDRSQPPYTDYTHKNDPGHH
jgi:hypothetical protein